MLSSDQQLVSCNYLWLACPGYPLSYVSWPGLVPAIEISIFCATTKSAVLCSSGIPNVAKVLTLQVERR